MEKKHKKQIKAVGANLGPASTESNKEGIIPIMSEGAGLVEKEISKVDLLGNEVGKINHKQETDIPKAKNIEDALREFTFKYCHFFIAELDAFVFINLIGVFQVCKYHKQIKFEELVIQLTDEEFTLFLEQRVVKQKEYFNNPIIFKP